MHLYKPLTIALLCILAAGKVSATHYFGLDLYYTHISGNTYRVTMVAFGDCGGAQFPSFSTTRPRVYVRQGATNVFDTYLDQEPPKEGIEVTNACPDDLKRTTCVDPLGTIPGVKKFVYSRELTLPYTAADWKFVYLGETDGATTAGRSNSLTNVSPPGIISLEATLDNTLQHNSSPQFSTIATQFYCINNPVTYQPGAKDTDGDSLVYELVPGLNGPAQVQYISGFSGSAPLAADQGTFQFSNTTGQLDFTPDRFQKSLVVYRLSEYRNGQLIGTIMREMTIVVIACNNNPPAGYITNATGAELIDRLTVQTCAGNHQVAFDIDPTDSDPQHNITITAGDLPQNATLDITANNTTQPQSRFVWNMPDLPEGDYKFSVTYADDGCPPTRQKQEYTIRIKHEDITAETQPANCTQQGLVKIIPPANWMPWGHRIDRDATPVYNITRVLTPTWSDSLPTGKYNIYASNEIGCTAETAVEITSDCEVADLPTAFSPNGDGHNDIYLVRGMNVHDMHLRIYNRWGQLIFQSRDINQGWDGKYNGKEAPVEAYAYVLSLVFKSGKTLQKQGNITLLR